MKKTWQKTRQDKTSKQSSKPISTRSKFMSLTQSPAQSAGKRVRARHDWFWRYFWLDDSGVRFLNQSLTVVMSSQSTRQQAIAELPLFQNESGSQPFILKWVWLVRQWTCKKNLFPFVRLYIKTRFERGVIATRKWLICFRQSIILKACFEVEMKL